MSTSISGDYSSYPLAKTICDQPCSEFSELLRSHKISDTEYVRIRNILNRPPTMAELGIFSAMWSEHCSYKSSRVHLKRLPTKGPQVVVGPGENAGVVRISGKLCVAFKMESHNHPSYIEPYQGAATGVGGILRDVFCMGARPFANLNCLRFGERIHPRTKYLVTNVVKGIGDYGNCIGVPTVGGSVSYHKSYNGNCLVNAMTLGTIHEDQIFKGFARGPGNLVVYVGSATGRDGIHGATMASDRFDSQASKSKTTIQVGDPFKEKLLLEATLEVLDKGLVVGLQDMGAAGLTSSAFEMAGRAENGLLIDLDKVPIRTSAMSAYELLLSESQERMLMVIKPECWEPLKEILDRWLLDAAIIGKVTTTGRVQIYHQGILEADVPVGPITDDAPQYTRPIKARSEEVWSEEEIRQSDRDICAKIAKWGVLESLKNLMEEPGDITSIHLQYDKHIGNRTVKGPESQGAAVLWMKSDLADPQEPWLGVATVALCNERYCLVDPFWGAAHGVTKAARMIAAAGGKGLATTDCLNYGNPENPEVMWEISQGIDGIGLACQELQTPIVSGNVSLYNETDGQSIAPTPMIGMVGKVDDVRLSPSATIVGGGDLYLITPKGLSPRFGGSLVAKAMGVSKCGPIPAISWDGERESMNFLLTMTRLGALQSCRDIGSGGLLVTATKMILSSDPNQEGYQLDLDGAAIQSAQLGQDQKLSQKLSSTPEILCALGERSGSYLVVLHQDKIPLCRDEIQDLKYNHFTKIGVITKSATSALSWSQSDSMPFQVSIKELLPSFQKWSTT